MSQLVNTGMQRSLTLVVKKTVGSVTSSQTFDGRLAFSSYGAISDAQLARMPQAEFQQRLADFKTYVQSIIPGLAIDATTEAGRGAYRTATDSCPVGYTSEADDEVPTTPWDDGSGTTTPPPDAGSNTESTTSPSDTGAGKNTTTLPMSLSQAISE